MPRYIDAEKLAEKIIEDKVLFIAKEDLLRDGYVLQTLFADLSEVVSNIPTADVVPRSEVARDIKAFEKKVNKIYNRYVFEDTDYAEDDVAREAVINALFDVSYDLDELNEKYTKGGEDRDSSGDVGSGSEGEE